MNNFKKTTVQNFTKGSVVTTEECKYWKQLGVSINYCQFKHKIINLIIFLESSVHQGIWID